MVLALDPVGPQGQLAAGAGPLVVGEEGVVAHGGRERALGEAEHHHEVEVEPDAHLDRADEHAVAEPAHPAEVVLELELEGAVEHVEGDRTLDGIERAEAGEGLLHPLGSLALRGRPSRHGGRRRRAAARASAGPTRRARSSGAAGPPPP